ncbi:helix-turn-helix domain-containing protein [Microbacteriaceae bacterium 4G12]
MAKFSFEAKLNAVQDYLEGTESYRDIGKRIGIDHKAIAKWVALYKTYGINGLKPGYTNYSVQFKINEIVSYPTDSAFLPDYLGAKFECIIVK